MRPRKREKFFPIPSLGSPETRRIYLGGNLAVWLKHSIPVTVKPKPCLPWDTGSLERLCYFRSFGLGKAVYWFYFIILGYLFIWLCWVLVMTRDLWPGIQPVAPALEVGSLSHWTTREVDFTLKTQFSIMETPMKWTWHHNHLKTSGF